MYLGLAEFVEYVEQNKENYRNKLENKHLKSSEKSAGKTPFFAKKDMKIVELWTNSIL